MLKKNANTNISPPSSRFWLFFFEVSYDTNNSRVSSKLDLMPVFFLSKFGKGLVTNILQTKAVQVPKRFVLVAKSTPTENIFLYSSYNLGVKNVKSKKKICQLTEF